METILITGANAGIGFEIARGVLKSGKEVVMVCRNQDKAKKARERLILETDNDNVQTVIADLTRFSDIANIARYVRKNFESIDVLVNNAGTIYSKRELNEDRIEKTFMVNHIAPFYLTHLLLPVLVKSESAKIININSDSHYMARLKLDNLNLEKNYNILRAYAHSKLANVMFTYEFERQNPHDHISIYAVHPGLVNTDIGAKQSTWFHRTFWNLRSRSGKTPAGGAETALRIALDKASHFPSGKYWDEGEIKKSSKESYDREKAKALWEQSMELCKVQAYF